MPVGRIPNLQEVRLGALTGARAFRRVRKPCRCSRLRNAEKTLTDDEVNKAQEKLNQELARMTIVFK